MKGFFFCFVFSEVKIISHRKQKSKTPALGGVSGKWKSVYAINLTGTKNIFMVRIQPTYFSVWFFFFFARF